MLLASYAHAAPSARWVAGPWVLENVPGARNPWVDQHHGQVHIVYRVRDGGIGHLTGPGNGTPTAPMVLPGSVPTAAVARPWNMPVVAVDAQGNGHVAWGPQSGASQTGVWYARVAPDGSTVGAQKLTAYWSEDIAIAILDDRVHVLTNAVGDTPGVFDFAASTTTAGWTETQAWPYGNFDEISVSVAPWRGLAVLGRLDVPKRIDLTIAGNTETWGGFANHDNPPQPVTSIGKPRIAFDGSRELWAAVGWVDQTPSVVVVTDAGNAGWTTLSSSALFDPSDADGGGPSVGLAINDDGHRAVAWLAAEGPRLVVAIEAGGWGHPVALPGTEDATTFALCADGADFRVVFANSDGTLHTGRVSGADPVEPNDAGTDADASATPDALLADAPYEGASIADAGGADGGSDPSGEDDSGCVCSAVGRDRGAAERGLLGLAVLLVVARWRRPRCA